MYFHCKSFFQYEQYLNVLPRKYKYFICRLRLDGLPLHIHTGRYNISITPRSSRYCQMCMNTGNDLEDEFHFICVCPLYANLRKQYIKPYFYQKPSMFNFLE